MSFVFEVEQKKSRLKQLLKINQNRKYLKQINIYKA